MYQDDFRALTRAIPFVPFRVFLSNGETYVVRHPDMILVTPGTVHIAVPTPDGPPDAVGAARIVSLMHVVKVEMLSIPVGTAPGVSVPDSDHP
jgi:branched-subunit amino acid transport protein AzlD